MPCRVAAIADAYTAWLNDAARGWTLPQGVPSLSATRTWRPVMQLEKEDAALKIEVVPVTLDPIWLAGRGVGRNEYLMLLFARQLFTPAGAAASTDIPEAWLDERAGLIEDIARASKNLQLTTNQPGGVLVAVKPETGVRIDPLVDYGALQNRRSFESATALTWLEVGNY
jgi:hypothetical protein